MANARICSTACLVECDTKLKCLMCKLSYHLFCYKIDSTNANNIGGTSNIQFVCDRCLIKINSEENTTQNTNKIPSLTSTFNELLDLKKTVYEIRDSVKTTELAVTKKVLPSANVSQSPSLTRRFTNTFASSSSSSTTPTLKTPVTFGTGVVNENVLGRPIQPKQTNIQAKKTLFTKSIFVTRLDPFLTCEKVLDYIKSKGVNISEANIECRKLVKLNQDLSQLSFCSFKLSTNNELFATLMEPSLWPPTVGIREFMANTNVSKRTAATLSPTTSSVESPTSRLSKLKKTDDNGTPTTPIRINKLANNQQRVGNNQNIRNFCNGTA